MPMQKDLEQIHNTLSEILKESEELSHRQYTADDVLKLQEKVSKIDEQYKEGIIDDRNKNNPSDDPYEHKGQGVVANDLAKVHQTLHSLLERAK
ncbi:hypothetical protein BDB01DRAFT_847193 [Pilobolus umbonatus]|nr:hypothetical protein BDB01DRAFT_847193 [Pilobolus umbonatus]